MKDESIKAIKTIAGGLFHSILTKNRRELSGRDWELLCSHLQIDTDTIHSVSPIPNGFTLSTRVVSLRYVHDNCHIEKRKVEVTFHAQPENLSIWKRWITRSRSSCHSNSLRFPSMQLMDTAKVTRSLTTFMSWPIFLKRIRNMRGRSGTSQNFRSNA